jgi:exodeoxyribonuclease V alpha subunit
VRHVLQEIAGEGHCAAYREALAASQAATLLEIPPPIIEQAIGEELAEENLVEEPIEGAPPSSSPPCSGPSVGIAESLARLGAPRPLGTHRPERAIPWVEGRPG